MEDRRNARSVGCRWPSSLRYDALQERISLSTQKPYHARERPSSITLLFPLGNNDNKKRRSYRSESADEKDILHRGNISTEGSLCDRHSFSLSPCAPSEYRRVPPISLRDEFLKRARYSPDWYRASTFSSSLPYTSLGSRLTRGRVAAFATENYFIPPQRAVDEGKLVVVLDLDETLVYSRSGVIIPRPGTNRLLDVLCGRCETIIWTAGEKPYAMEVLQLIDPNHCIQHCIYRHEKWWTDKPGYVKDVSALGRPLDRTIIIDNTPDCLRASSRNGLLVRDFRGENVGYPKLDNTLFIIADVIEDVLNGSQIPVEAFHNHPQLQRRSFQCDVGGAVDLLTLKQDSFLDANSSRARLLTLYRAQRT